MKIIRSSPSTGSIFWVLITTLVLCFNIPVTHAQEAVTILKDSTQVLTIPIEQIPIASGESIIKATRIAESLIKKERINALKAENDSLMVIVDSLLERQKNIDINSYSNRSLNNLQNYWSDQNIRVNNEKEKLAGVIKILNDKLNTLESDLELWNNTKKKIDPQQTANTVNKVIDEVIVHIDSVNALILAKINELFLSLNQTNRRSVDIEDIINSIKSIHQERQTHLFKRSQPSFITLNYTGRTEWNLRDNINAFADSDFALLKSYFQNNKTLFFYYALYLAALVLLFIYFNRKIHNLKAESLSQYELAVKEILSMPVSAALILGLFSSLLFFVNRPLLLDDIAIFLVSIPLIIIVLKLSGSISRKYIFLFGFVLVLRFINYIFPPEVILHRLIILIIGTIEVFVFLDLLRYFKKQHFKNQLLQSFINLVIIVQIAFALVGIIGNFYGSVMMADIAINVPVTNTFAGFLFFISAEIVIGLIHFAIDGTYLGKLNIVKNYKIYLKKRTVEITMFIVIIIWLNTMMKVLGISDNIYAFFHEMFSKDYRLGESGSFTIGSIFLFFFVVWLSVIISKIIKVILEEDVFNKLTLKKGVPRMISVMTGYTLVIIGVFIAVSAAGMPVDRLTIIFGAFSVGIGFGLQNIFNNLVSGIILLFERPIQIGDVVEVGTLIGTVKTMGIRSSNLRTFDGAEVIVPNGHLISNEVTNWTLSDNKRRIEIFSGVAYGSDVHKVQKLFLKLLDEHPDILKDPHPNVYFNDMGESSLDFRILFWTENFDEWQRIRSEVVFKIHDYLYEEGIEIPFPQRDLHIRSIKGNIDLNGEDKK